MNVPSSHPSELAVSQVESEAAVLEVSGLSISFRGRNGLVRVTDDVSFVLRPNRTLALVGESGSGKTVTSLAIMGLLPRQSSQVSGSVFLDGRDLVGADEKQLRSIRGAEIAMIFQEPMTSLNPVFTIGNQMTEVIRQHFRLTGDEIRSRAVEMLSRVGIASPERHLRSYPHEFSGGMLQRVMIATALACEPRILIADEPTTALDVTVQAQILDLVKEVSRELGLAVLWVTHDMGVVADIADDVAVMYAGQIGEEAPVYDLFSAPRHPYTAGLLGSIPQSVGKSRRASIPGRPPTPDRFPAGCRFAPRCSFVVPECQEAPVALQDLDGWRVRCCRHGQLGDLLEVVT